MDVNREEFMRFVNLVPSPACLSNDETLEIVSYNDAFRELIGDARGENLRDLLQLKVDIVQKKKEGKFIYMLPITIIDKDYKAIFLFPKFFIGCILIKNDKIESFWESEYRYLMNLIPFGVATVSVDGTLEYINRPLLNILGCTDECDKYTGINVFEIDKLQGNNVLEALSLVFDEGVVLSGLTRLPCHGRKPTLAKFHMYPLRFEKELFKVVVVFQPEEEELETTSDEELLRSQKLELVGMLAGGLAHDMNNLITSLMAYVDDSLDRIRKDDLHTVEKNLEEMRSITQGAARLVFQLLAFSRRQPMEQKVVDIREVVEGLTSMLDRLIGERIRLVVINHPEPLWTRIDVGQLQQVIINLVVNARDAIEGDGVITLRTFQDEEEVVVEVEDTGKGISGEILPHIFEPFFTTKRDGTGLGLAMTYGIVRQHGGNIIVRSRPGHGTVFSVHLPKVASYQFSEHQNELVTEALHEEDHVECDENHASVLFVEDDHIIRRVITKTLKREGYDVLAAANGEMALEILENVDTLDVLITDVVMPGMSGLELAREVKARFPDTKVIFTSGYIDGMPEAQSPAVHFLPKPYTTKDLIKAIRLCLANGEASSG